MQSQFKFQEDFFVDTNKMILNFTWKSKGHKSAKTI